MSFRERVVEEDRNWVFEEERRREREREHAPAYDAPAIGPDPTLLMVVQVPHGQEGVVVNKVAREASVNGVTLMLWHGRPRGRHRRAMKLLFGRKLGRRLTG